MLLLFLILGFYLAFFNDFRYNNSLKKLKNIKCCQVALSVSVYFCEKIFKAVRKKDYIYRHENFPFFYNPQFISNIASCYKQMS